MYGEHRYKLQWEIYSATLACSQVPFMLLRWFQDPKYRGSFQIYLDQKHRLTRVDTGWHGLTGVDTGWHGPHFHATPLGLEWKAPAKGLLMGLPSLWILKMLQSMQNWEGENLKLYPLQPLIFCPLPALSILINPKFVIFIESAIPFITSYNWQMARTVVFGPREREFAANLGWFFLPQRSVGLQRVYHKQGLVSMLFGDLFHITKPHICWRWDEISPFYLGDVKHWDIETTPW